MTTITDINKHITSFINIKDAINFSLINKNINNDISNIVSKKVSKINIELIQQLDKLHSLDYFSHINFNEMDFIQFIDLIKYKDYKNKNIIHNLINIINIMEPIENKTKRNILCIFFFNKLYIYLKHTFNTNLYIMCMQKLMTVDKNEEYTEELKKLHTLFMYL